MGFGPESEGVPGCRVRCGAAEQPRNVALGSPREGRTRQLLEPGASLVVVLQHVVEERHRAALAFGSLGEPTTRRQRSNLLNKKSTIFFI